VNAETEATNDENRAKLLESAAVDAENLATQNEATVGGTTFGAILSDY